MADSRGADEFIAGGTRFTLPDLQLYTTAKFMAKVNTAKRTPPFDGREAYFRRADTPRSGSRRRRGRDVDIQWRQGRGEAAAATWISQ